MTGRKVARSISMLRVCKGVTRERRAIRKGLSSCRFASFVDLTIRGPKGQLTIAD